MSATSASNTGTLLFVSAGAGSAAAAQADPGNCGQCPGRGRLSFGARALGGDVAYGVNKLPVTTGRVLLFGLQTASGSVWRFQGASRGAHSRLQGMAMQVTSPAHRDLVMFLPILQRAHLYIELTVTQIHCLEFPEFRFGN